MAWIDSIKAHIVSNSLGTEGTDLFIGTMDDQGQVVPVTGLAEYKGTTRQVMGAGNPGLDIPMLQVAVRAPTYTAARDRITAIRDLLKAIVNTTVEGTAFVRVEPDGVLKDVGRDDKGRQQFTADFEVWL